MTSLFLVLASLVLLATMFYLTVSVNDFEKKVLDLDAILKRRYKVQPKIPAKPGSTTGRAEPGAAGSLPAGKSQGHAG